MGLHCLVCVGRAAIGRGEYVLFYAVGVYGWTIVGDNICEGGWEW